VKWTDYTNAYNSLTNCEYEVNELTGNGNYVNLLKLAGEKIVKSLQVNLFLADLSHLKPLRPARLPALFQPDPMKTFVQSSIEYLHGLITRQTNVDKDRSKVFTVIQLPSKSLIHVHFNINKSRQ